MNKPFYETPNLRDQANERAWELSPRTQAQATPLNDVTTIYGEAARPYNIKGRL